MPLPVRFHDSVEPDVLEAVTQINSHSSRAAEVFAERYAEAIEAVEMFPLAGKPYLAELRRRRINGFPYFLVYKAYADHVLVVAVLNARRDPERLRAIVGGRI